MTLVEFSVRTPSEFVEPLSQLFRRYGEHGVVVEADGGYNPDEGETPRADAWVTLRTYVADDELLAERRGQFGVGVRLIAHVGPVGDLAERRIEESDWRDAYKRYLGVLEVGERILVVPSWEEPASAEGRKTIKLDPGLAFGTGHHPTTRMCLELVEKLLRPGASVLDLGCGSGILSIAAAKLGAGAVLGLDVGADAVRVASRNLRDNAVERQVTVVRGTLPAGIGDRRFDLVMANISARVVVDLAEHMTEAIVPGGSAIISGVLDERRNEVVEALEACGLSIAEVREMDDWLALHAARPV